MKMMLNLYLLKQRIFYFAGEVKPEAIDSLPAGYTVGENSKTGLPILKKA